MQHTVCHILTLISEIRGYLLCLQFRLVLPASVTTLNRHLQTYFLLSGYVVVKFIKPLETIFFVLSKSF